jgi:hypothetical protein
VAAVPDGGFTVAWSAGDGDESGVVGRRYDAAGGPAGSVFAVNSHTTHGQYDAAIAGAADGGFVVVWDRPQYSSPALSGQLFASDGSPVGAEFRVDEPPAPWVQYGRKPSVAMAGGKFVVAWENGGEVVARRWDATGTPSGQAFYVNSYTTGRQHAISVAGAPDGRFAVVWHGARMGSNDVFGRTYGADGQPASAEFLVGSTFSNQRNPSAAPLPDGGFVVVWQSYHADGSHYAVMGQRLDGIGQPLGAEFQVNSYTTYYQGAARVASGPDGRYVVVWSSEWQDGSQGGVFAQRYNAKGERVGSELLVNSYTTGRQGHAVAADLGAGRFVVAWHSNGDGVYQVWARLYADDLIFSDGFQPD